MASDLGVPLVQQPVYPYDETPPLDDIMSLITGTTIQWGTDPHITSHELTELNYLFFWISCHSIWPISHLHTIPIERYSFLYAFVTDASICFPSLFISTLVEVYRRVWAERKMILDEVDLEIRRSFDHRGCLF